MSAVLRKLVRERARARCEYCHLPDLLPHLVRFHLEHIRARRHHGAHAATNLAWACARCNALKGTDLSGVDPDSNRVVRLFHPRRDRWPEHYRVSALRIEPLTAKGRATAWLLEFNTEERLELRAAYHELGFW